MAFADGAYGAGIMTSAAEIRPVLSKTKLGVLVGLAALVMLIDGADLAALPLAVLYIARDWQIEPADFGVALAAMNMGFGIGALLLGPLGDRYGRKPVIVLAVVAVGILTVATGYAHDTWHFTALRLLTGVAFGAALINLNALLAELVPTNFRARLIALVSCGVPVGGAGFALAVPLMVPVGGWPAIFVWLGVGIVVLALALQFWMPGNKVQTGDAGQPSAEDEATVWQRFAAPLSAEYRLATFVLIGLYTVNALMVSMLAAWLPTLLSMAGFEIDQAARVSSFLKIGGLVGGLALSYFIDRGRPVPSLLASYAMLGAALFAFGVVPVGVASWGALLVVVGIGTYGTQMCIVALGTFFYPSRMLASALGLAAAVARLGAVGGPLLGQLLLELDFSTTQFLLVLLGPIVCCMICVALISRVKMVRGEAQAA